MKKILLALTFLLISMSTTEANEFDCLVEAIYHEARSEEMIPQLAVANVILVRVESSDFPDTICKVVHQGKYWEGNPVRDRCQFSYWCDGKSEKMPNIEALIKVISVAQMSLKGVQVKQTVGATHYHASYVTPSWASDPRLKSVGAVGLHIFYIDMREK
tara:strand:+ start:308 stop:784 length:477 start_codon:yes stop_codon:yes gene_type:complete